MVSSAERYLRAIETPLKCPDCVAHYVSKWPEDSELLSSDRLDIPGRLRICLGQSLLRLGIGRQRFWTRNRECLVLASKWSSDQGNGPSACVHTSARRCGI